MDDEDCILISDTDDIYDQYNMHVHQIEFCSVCAWFIVVRVHGLWFAKKKLFSLKPFKMSSPCSRDVSTICLFDVDGTLTAPRKVTMVYTGLKHVSCVCRDYMVYCNKG